MSGGGGIFGAIASLDKQIQSLTDPINRYIDPLATQGHRVVSDKLNDAFNPKQMGTPANTGAQRTADQNAATNRAVAATAAAGGGTGAGAKDMVTLPPNTPEGDRMRLSKMAAIAGSTNTLLGN